MRIASVSTATFISLAACLPSLFRDESTPVKMVFRKIELSFQVPDPNYLARITEIRKVSDEIWVLCEVRRLPCEAPQVLSQVQDGLSIRLPNLPLKYIITGKSWNWVNNEKYTFLKDRSLNETNKLRDRFRTGEGWFAREEPSFRNLDHLDPERES